MAVVSEAGAVDCLADKFDLAMEKLLQPAEPHNVIGMCFSSRMSMNASASAARIAANAAARAAVRSSSGASSLTSSALPTSPLSSDTPTAANAVPLTRFLAAAPPPTLMSNSSSRAHPTGQGLGQGATASRLSSPGGSGHVSVAGVAVQLDDGAGQLHEEVEQEDLDDRAMAPLWLQVRGADGQVAGLLYLAASSHRLAGCTQASLSRVASVPSCRSGCCKLD